MRATAELCFAMVVYHVFEAFVYQLIWTWFAVPTLHLPALSKIETLVMLWVVRRMARLEYLRAPAHDDDLDHHPDMIKYADAIRHDLRVLIMGFALHVGQLYVQKHYM